MFDSDKLSVSCSEPSGESSQCSRLPRVCLFLGSRPRDSTIRRDNGRRVHKICGSHAVVNHIRIAGRASATKLASWCRVSGHNFSIGSGGQEAVKGLVLYRVPAPAVQSCVRWRVVLFPVPETVRGEWTGAFLFLNLPFLPI